MFRTELHKQASEIQISHQDKTLLLGSCFTQHIGAKLEEAKFETSNNPFGILYNPVSIFKSLNVIAEQKHYEKDDLIFHNECYHSFEHHSTFSNTNSDACLQQINNAINSGYAFLKDAKYCFISLGTAYAFKHITQNKIVANCHKIKSSEFKKKLLTVQQIVDSFDLTITHLQKTNPSLQFIFTISPIRHLKNGFHENQLSKSTLLLAIEQLQKKYQQVHYFPSYEIMMDDLRDYRFYTDDMLHPSKQAIEYIWDYFKSSYFSSDTLKLHEQIVKINNALNHKPFNADSVAHKKFVGKLDLEIKELTSKHSHISFV